MPAAIVNSNNVIFANGAGGNFPVSASFAIGGIDNALVSSMTYQVVRPTISTTGNTVIIKNELGGSGEFVMIPYTNDHGIVQYNSGHIEIVDPTDKPTCSAYAMTTGNPSVTLDPPNSLLHLRITTPYNYDGPEYYTAVVGNNQYIMSSGVYCDFTKAYGEDNALDWRKAGSGNYSL